LYLRALPHSLALTREGSNTALALLEQALVIDPDYAVVAARAAFCYQRRLVQRWAVDPEAEQRRSLELAHRALATGPNDPETLALAGLTIAYRGELRAGLAAVERAIALNPNGALALTLAGWVNGYRGEPAIAVTMFERAMRLNPRDPAAFNTYAGLSMAH